MNVCLAHEVHTCLWSIKYINEKNKKCKRQSTTKRPLSTHEIISCVKPCHRLLIVPYIFSFSPQFVVRAVFPKWKLDSDPLLLGENLSNLEVRALPVSAASFPTFSLFLLPSHTGPLPAFGMCPALSQHRAGVHAVPLLGHSSLAFSLGEFLSASTSQSIRSSLPARLPWLNKSRFL